MTSYPFLSDTLNAFLSEVLLALFLELLLDYFTFLTDIINFFSHIGTYFDLYLSNYWDDEELDDYIETTWYPQSSLEVLDVVFENKMLFNIVFFSFIKTSFLYLKAFIFEFLGKIFAFNSFIILFSCYGLFYKNAILFMGLFRPVLSDAVVGNFLLLYKRFYLNYKIKFFYGRNYK